MTLLMNPVSEEMCSKTKAGKLSRLESSQKAQRLFD